MRKVIVPKLSETGDLLVNGNVTAKGTINGTVKSSGDLTISSSANSTSKTLAVYLSGAERGSVYEVTVVYNFNPAGSSYYRSIWHGIISLPTGYDANNGVYTALYCSTICSNASTNFASYTPACQFSDDGSTVKKTNAAWYGKIALTFGSHVVFSGDSVPKLINASARKLA